MDEALKLAQGLPAPAFATVEVREVGLDLRRAPRSR
jgi:hypothetical protein